MADHYRAACERLNDVTDLRSRLTAHYATGRNDPKRVADLHDKIRHNLKLAEIHSTLALVQVTADQRLVR